LTLVGRNNEKLNYTAHVRQAWNPSQFQIGNRFHVTLRIVSSVSHLQAMLTGDTLKD